MASRRLGSGSATAVSAKALKPKKRKYAIRIPAAFSKRVLEALQRDGYSVKRKSVWVEEALAGLSRHDPDLGDSLVGDRAEGRNDTQVVLVLSPNGGDVLQDLIIRLRLQMPTIEGVQSVVLRSAMRFRIRNPQYFLH